jgi:hypothetical protein
MVNLELTDRQFEILAGTVTAALMNCPEDHNEGIKDLRKVILQAYQREAQQ